MEVLEKVGDAVGQMFGGIERGIRGIFGSSNDRDVKKLGFIRNEKSGETKILAGSMLDYVAGQLSRFNITWGHQGIGQAHTATLTAVDGGRIARAGRLYSIADVPPGRHSFVWASSEDMPGERNPTVQVGLGYVDPLDEGTPWGKKTAQFRVNNRAQDGTVPIVID